MNELAARAALSDPSTAPDALAAIAQQFPQLRAQVAAHPNAYPQLVQWINDQAAAAPAAAQFAAAPAVTPAPFAAPPAPVAYPSSAQPGVAASAPMPVAYAPSTTQPATVAPGVASPRRKISWAQVAIAFVAGLVVAGAVAATLLLTGVVRLSGGATSTTQGPGFSTPEAAAEAYLQGVKAKDIDAMLSTFAVESFAQQCDYTAYLTRMKAQTSSGMSLYCPFPQSDPLGKQANIETRQGSVISQVYRTVLAASPHLAEDIALFNDSDVQAFQAQTQADFANYLFAGISNVVVADPTVLEPIYGSAANMKNVGLVAGSYGLSADDYRDVALTFGLQGQKWAFCPSVGRYDGRWYLISTQSVLSILMNVPATSGGLFQMP